MQNPINTPSSLTPPATINDATQVLCPVCGDEHTHCGDSYTVDSQDTPRVAWSGRGSVTRLQWQGECGHAWELCFGFHKGHTYSWVEQVPTVEGELAELSLRDARVRAQTRAAVLAERR